MTAAARRVEILVEAAIEAPHVMYPKGPIRAITSYQTVLDAVAGEIVLVKLECHHEAALVGPNLTIHSVVRCPICLYEKHKSKNETVIG